MSLSRLAFKTLKAPARTRLYSPTARLDALERDFCLQSAIYPVDWRPPHFRQIAECGRRGHPGAREDVPPTKLLGRCHCGIHAWNHIDAAINNICNSCGHFNLCVAVALSGRIRAGQYALRGQRCQVMAVIMPDLGKMKLLANNLFSKYVRTQIIEIIESNGLPVEDYGEHWHDPVWVRDWAARRNLIPQSDMVVADNLLEGLEAS